MISSCPRLIRLRAMAEPMLPRPMNPTLILSSRGAWEHRFSRYVLRFFLFRLRRWAFASSFGKKFDHLPIECGNVVRFPARNQIPIHDDFFVHPLRSGISKVGLDRRPRSYTTATRSTGFDHAPRSVTYGRHRFAGSEKRSYELHSLRLHSQLIGIDHTSGQQQRVEFFSPHFAQ